MINTTINTTYQPQQSKLAQMGIKLEPPPNFPDNHGLDYVKKQPFDLNSPQIAPPVSESISSLASGLIDSFK